MRVITKKSNVRTTATTENLIDEYGRLNALIKELTAKKDALREKIIAQYGLGEHSGDKYVISIVSQKGIVLDPFKVVEKIGVTETLQIATISVEKARALLGYEIYDCVKEEKTITKVFVKERQ